MTHPMKTCCGNKLNDGDFDAALHRFVIKFASEHKSMEECREFEKDILTIANAKAYSKFRSKMYSAQHPQREEFTDELIDLLHIMWDGYENGTPAYEYDFDNSPGGFLGNAFQISDDKETRICEILNKYRPVKTLPSPPKAEK